MFADIISLLPKYRVIHLLGTSRLRERYARSKLGQVWVSLAQFINVVLLGIAWSIIWRQPIDSQLPYVAVGFIVYGLIATTLNEASGIIISESQYYMNSRTPAMLSVISHVYRNILIYLYNIPSIFIIVMWSESAHFKFESIWFIGIILVSFFILFWSYFIAATSVRFRDLIQIYGLFFQSAFLLSPLMWRLEYMAEENRNLFLLNPMAAALEIIRNPIIGLKIPEFAIISLIVWTALGLTLAYYCHRRLERKLTLWL